MARWRFASLIAICFICGAAAHTQPSGYVYGHIWDPSFAGVSGASITVLNEESGFRRLAESQPDGGYAVGSLAPGSYKLTVRKDGFRSMIRFHIAVEKLRPVRADFLLSLGSVLETVTVEGSAPLVRREDVSVATLISQAEIENLPLNARGVLGLTEMAPGTSVVPATRGDDGQFVTDGQRPNTNSFTVDGISANNGIAAGGVAAQTAGGALPVMSAFGSLDSLIPLDAVQEFRIQTSTSASEFGRLPGANIAITSRAGSDEFHGSGAFRFRHELSGANDWFANRAGESLTRSREENTALTFGGPLRRHSAFFFLSYERMELDQPFAWLAPVPSLYEREAAPDWLKPALNLFPEPNGPPLGNGLAAWNARNWRPGVLDAGSARIDQMLGSHATLFARYTDSPSANDFGSFQVSHLEFRSWSGTLGLNLRAGPDAMVDFRVNQSATSAHSIWSGNADCQLLPLTTQFGYPTCNMLVRFQINGVGQLVSGREGDRRQRQFQFVQTGNWKRGSHSLRFGTDFRRIVPARHDPYSALNLIVDSLRQTGYTGNYWIGQSAAQNSSTEIRELSVWA